MSALFIHNLWPPNPASEITGNPTLLRPNGVPALPWRVGGRVEGPTLWSRGRSQGPEGVLTERSEGD